MRPSLPIIIVLAAGLVVAMSEAQPPPQSGAKTPQKPPKSSGRAIIPGIGGALGAGQKRPPKPSQQPIVRPAPANPFPLLGQQGVGPLVPAPVAGPGIRPGLPALPGTGLTARTGRASINGAIARRWLSLTPAESARELARLKALGIGLTRVDVGAADVAQVGGGLNWAKLDQLVSFLKAAGLQMVPVLDTLPGDSENARYTRNKAYGAAFASRYAGSMTRIALRGMGDDRSRAADWVALASGVRMGNGVAAIAYVLKASELTKSNVDFSDNLLSPLMDAVAIVDVAVSPGLAADTLASSEALSSRSVAGKAVWVLGWGLSAEPGLNHLMIRRRAGDWLESMQSTPQVELALYDEAFARTKVASVERAYIALNDAKPYQAVSLALHEGSVGLPIAENAPRSSFLAAPKANPNGAISRDTEVEVSAGKTRSMPALFAGVFFPDVPAAATMLSAAAKAVREAKPSYFVVEPFGHPDRVRLQGGIGGSQSAARRLVLDFSHLDAVAREALASNASIVIRMGIPPSAIGTKSAESALPADEALYAELIRETAKHVITLGVKTRWELAYSGARSQAPGTDWANLYLQTVRALREVEPAARLGMLAVPSNKLSLLSDALAALGNAPAPAFLSVSVVGDTVEQARAAIADARKLIRTAKLPATTEVWLSDWGPDAWAQGTVDWNSRVRDAVSLLYALDGEGISAGVYTAAYDQPGPVGATRGRKAVGMVDGEGKPTLISRFAAQIAGAGLLSAITDDPGVSVLAYSSGGAAQALVWASSVQTNESLSAFRLRVDDKGAGRFQGSLRFLGQAPPGLEQGASIAVDGQERELNLPLIPREITWVSLRPSRESGVSVIVTADRRDLAPGDRATLTVSLRNRQRSAITAPFELNLSASLTSTQKVPASISLAPGQERVVTLQVRQVPGAANPISLATVGFGGVSASVGFLTTISSSLQVEEERLDIRESGAKPDSLEASAVARLVVTSRRSNAEELSLSSGKSTQSVRVPAMGTAAANLRVWPPSASPGVWVLPVKLTAPPALGTGTPELRASAELLIGVPANSFTSGEKPRLNGDLAEWGDAASLPLREFQSAGAVGTKPDPGSQAMTMWDAEYLYVGISVVDDTHVAPMNLGVIDKGDRVELVLAIPPITGSWNKVAPMRVMMSHAEQGAMVALASPQGFVLAPSVKVVSRRVGRRTYYEAALPWALVGKQRVEPGELALVGLRLSSSLGGGLEFGDVAAGVKNPKWLTGLRLSSRAGKP